MTAHGVTAGVDLAAMLATAEQFVREELVPLEPTMIGAPWATIEPVLARLRARAGARGLWAPFLPASLGGLDLPLDAFARLSETLGWTPFGHVVCNGQAPDVGNMELLLHFGTPAQRASFLEPLARGETRSCFAMTEPEHAGSNPVWMSTHAERDGDDWVITGHKWFPSSADGAAFALVMAVTDPDATTPHARASHLLVPLPAKGFTIVRNIAVMGESGGGWAGHAEVRLDGVRVPVANTLGPAGHGFALAQERHLRARVRPHVPPPRDTRARAGRHAGEPPGGAVLDCGVPHRDPRRAAHGAGRGDAHGARPAAGGARRDRVHQGVRQRHAAAGPGPRDPDAWRAGMTDDLPLAWWYRHERAARIYDGADEVHKLTIARRALRPYLANPDLPTP
jgi:acyl-CoA dehydrogenase